MGRRHAVGNHGVPSMVAGWALLALIGWCARAGATEVKGAVEGEWTGSGSPYHVTGELDVAAGKTLTIDAGVTVEFDPAVCLIVQGALVVQGTADSGVKFVRAKADTAWGGVAITGAKATADILYLELTGATVAKSTLPDFPADFPAAFKNTNGAKTSIRNSWFHDFPNPCIDNGKGGELTVLDTLVEVCHEAIHSAQSYADIERVHIQHVTGYSDFIDFDNDSTPHSIVRDCLLEDNESDDGIDTLETNCLIENTVIIGVHQGKALDFEGVSTPVIRNCLVLDSFAGLVSKDGVTPEYHHVTVAGCKTGVWCFQKNAGKGGGHGSGESLILWNNAKQFDIDSLSSFGLTYSDVQGGYKGTGNIDADPLFVDPAGGDYHLKAGSPAIGAGKDGSDMGCYPYAGPPPAKFIRGDANGDRAIDISDPVAILFHLFGGLEVPCLDALDVDGKGQVDVTDAIGLLGYLFLDGPAPPAPFPDPGPLPDGATSLGCGG